MDQLRPAALTTVTDSPHVLGGAGGLRIPPVPAWAVIAVSVGWTVIGAWRMATRDA